MLWSDITFSQVDDSSILKLISWYSIDGLNGFNEYVVSRNMECSCWITVNRIYTYKQVLCKIQCIQVTPQPLLFTTWYYSQILVQLSLQVYSFYSIQCQPLVPLIVEMTSYLNLSCVLSVRDSCSNKLQNI